MQKVERKQHHERKNRRLFWLAAAIVLLAGSITAAALLGRKPPEIPVPEEHGGMLSDRNTWELSSVTVKRRGNPAWTLVQSEDGSLQPEGGAEWDPAEQQTRLLAEAVTQLRFEEILTADPAVYAENPEDFGLADPLVTITARYTDGTVLTAHIGNNTGLEEGWYYMTVEGDGNLYAVSAGTVEDVNLEYELLRPVPKPEIYGSLLDRITVTDGDGTVLAEWTLQGNITDRDAASNWAVTAPFTAPADEETVRSLKKSAENIRLGVFAAPATEEELERCGLAKPDRIVVFHMAAGSTGAVSDLGVYGVTEHEESTVTLMIGSARDELADYVRFNDEIFTVVHFTLAVFADPDPLGTAARYPVLVPLASLESLTTEENGIIREYVLRENEQGTAGKPERECLLDGEKISMEAFEAAYDRLLTVTYSGVLPKDAVWENPYKKYTFRTLSGGTHTIMLSNWDGIHDAVTVDGSTLFYLIRGGMTDLPGEDR